MRFHVNMFNHSDIGQRSLEDVVGIFGHQLRALGHQAIWDTGNTGFIRGSDGVNVLVEGFVPSHEPIIAAARQQGCRFLILATEEPTDRGFNHGTQEEMVKRQRDFHCVAKYADGIFYLVPGDHCQKFFSQFAPSYYLELGYAPSLVRKQMVVPEYDFGFYGSLTRRRHAILKKLANRINSVKAVKIVADFKTQEERDVQMQRAKVIVQIRKFDKMGLVSTSRCNTALSLGRPVVAEPHDLSKPWDEVVRFSSSMEGFFATCLAVRAAWKGVHQEQFEKFKTKFSPEICVGEPLRKLGITEDILQRSVA